MPTIILDKKELEQLVKEKYGVKEIIWKIVKKDVSIEFKQELGQKSSVSKDQERIELKKEFEKKTPGDGMGADRVMRGRF
jgi:hypothetical protein